MPIQVNDGSCSNVEVKKTCQGWIIAVDRASLFFISKHEEFSNIELLGSRIDAVDEEGIIDTVVDQSRIEAATFFFSMLLSRWSISKEKLIRIHEYANAVDQIFDWLLEE